jgi:hypothetical protein
MTKKLALLTDVILNLDVYLNTLLTKYVNIIANVLTMKTAKTTKLETNWQINASKQFVTKDWELVLKSLQIKNARSREKNAKPTVLQQMLAILLIVLKKQTLKTLFANIPQETVMTEFCAPKILVMLLLDVSILILLMTKVALLEDNAL